MPKPSEDILRVREERLAFFRQASSHSRFGLVSRGIVMWLLDLSDTRVNRLESDGRLQCRFVAGQRLFLFSTVEKYVKESRRSLRRRQGSSYTK